MRLAGLGASRFDDIRVDRALRQPLDAVQLVRFLVEDFNKLAADDLAFLFRVGKKLKGAKKSLCCVYANDVDAQVFSEQRHDLVALVVSQ